ncbi:MAG TPA: signal peptidase I [Terriglobia bacterium]|nr:signal peptidase I [Terriglobia bacterium]
MAGETYKKSTAREYFESLAITVILALFGTTFIVQAFKIPTPSMEDNLLVGDHLLVNKFAFGAPGSITDAVLPLREIHRGDVIVFKYPRDLSKHYVKRVIGLPGDRIHVVDSDVFVNGEVLAEPYKQLIPNRYREDFPGHQGSSFYQQDGISGWYEAFREGKDVVVPEGKYFAMGDNRDNSADSRFWGFVPRELVVGKALIIYWSYESDPEAYRQTQVRDVLRQTVDLVTNFFGKTRWSRTFKIIR